MTDQPTCPLCGSAEVSQIMYGMPSEPVRDPTVVLGGCVIDPDSPRWACRACGERWGRLERTST